jgi:quercetin dioxygenase-like cupin family protein
MGITHNQFDEIDWIDELARAKVDREVAEAAIAAGAKRKMLAEGETGLFVQFSDLPPGYRIEPHTHSHGEVIVVVSGSCRIDDGPEMHANDSVSIDAETRYGITCGPEGLRMLTIRAGEAVVTFQE